MGAMPNLASLNTLKEQLDAAELAQTKSDSEQALVAKGTEIESINTHFSRVAGRAGKYAVGQGTVRNRCANQTRRTGATAAGIGANQDADNNIASKVAEIAALTAAVCR